jgi:hypothetical protein
MKRLQAATLAAAPGDSLSWALLAAELGAVGLLFSSDLVPAVLVRFLQLFLRF